MKLSLFHEYRSLPCPSQRLKSIAVTIARGERGHKLGPVNVVLCSSRSIRILNRTFRKKDRVTDVLSFNYDDVEMSNEIYISLQRAKSQARRFGHSYEKEVVRLFVHGMFHLLGFDHHTKSERDHMESKERVYCPV